MSVSETGIPVTIDPSEPSPWSPPDMAEKFQDLVDKGLTDAPSRDEKEVRLDPKHPHPNDDPDGASFSATPKMADYTAELHEEAKSKIEAEHQDARRQLAAEIEQREALFTAAQQELLSANAIDWQRLQVQDPALAQQLMSEMQQRQARIPEFLQTVRTTMQRAQQQYRQRAIAAGYARLAEEHPEFREPESAKVAANTIREYAASLGFSPEEVESLIDPRYVSTLFDAARYRAIADKADESLAKVRAAPKMGPPGTRPRRSSLASAEERWRKSGFRDDEAGAEISEQFA